MASLIDHEDLPWFIPAGEDEWKCIGTTQIVYQHRSGWQGVWDAIKAAITGDERIVVPKKTTLTIWIHCQSKIDNAATFVSPVGYVDRGEGMSYATYINGSVVQQEDLEEGK